MNTLTCKWTESECGWYDTECGHAFMAEFGSLSDNGLIFCCYCGGELKAECNPFGVRDEDIT